MSNIVQLKYSDSSELSLVRKSLIGLRQCYPNFGKWFDSQVVPCLESKSREVFLAKDSNGFNGALILKNTPDEKKVCTLFVADDSQYHHIGLDFVRIASEQLETYELPITISEDVVSKFFNCDSFNFYTTDVKCGEYRKNTKEYFGYIMYHNPDRILWKNLKR